MISYERKRRNIQFGTCQRNVFRLSDLFAPCFSLKVDIRCGGRSVENSPFPLNVVQPNTAVVRLRQPEEPENKYLVRRELDIALDAAEGTRNMSSRVEGPDGENVPSSFDKGDDGLYHVKFVPYQAGTYKVMTQFFRPV